MWWRKERLRLTVIVVVSEVYNYRCLLSESRDSRQSQSINLRSMRLAAHLLYARQLEKIAQNGDSAAFKETYWSSVWYSDWATTPIDAEWWNSSHVCNGTMTCDIYSLSRTASISCSISIRICFREMGRNTEKYRIDAQSRFEPESYMFKVGKLKVFWIS